MVDERDELVNQTEEERVRLVLMASLRLGIYTNEHIRSIAVGVRRSNPE